MSKLYEEYNITVIIMCLLWAYAVAVIQLFYWLYLMKK